MKLIDIHHEDGRTSRIVESSLRVWQAKGWREGRMDEIATLEQTEAGVDPAVLGEGLADGPPVSGLNPPALQDRGDETSPSLPGADPAY